MNMTALLIILAIIVVAVFYLIGIYNQLVKLKNRFENAFAQIDVQLKRRYDLIPNLVETAKAYLKHERETLEAVIAARNEAMAGLDKAHADDGESISLLAQKESGLQSAMGRFQMVMEDYPELKADSTMMQLNEELSSTENKIAFARQAYNDSVMGYNTYKQSFPQNFFAVSFGHKNDAQMLEFEDRKVLEQAPKISF